MPVNPSRPSWRKPAGIFLILLLIAIWGFLVVTVLRRLEGEGLVEEYPNLTAYVARGEARPAYQRAFADQLAVFTQGQAA